MVVEDVIELQRGDVALGQWLASDGPLEVGSDPRCDIVIASDCVAPRAVLLRASGGTVYLSELSAQGQALRTQPMTLGTERRASFAAHSAATPGQGCARPTGSTVSAADLCGSRARGAHSRGAPKTPAHR